MPILYKKPNPYTTRDTSRDNDPKPAQFPYDGTSMYKGGYDLETARSLYEPDETGHLPSVDYRTGVWLKARDYPTAWKEFQASQLNLKLNKLVGSPIINEDGKMQYIKGYN